MALTITRPIVIKALPGGFKITDGGWRDLLYIYTEEIEANAVASGRLTPTDGKELAQRLARILDDEAKLSEGDSHSR